MRIEEIFNEKLTENGDRAFNSSLNKYIDLVFKLGEFRNNPNLINITLDKDNNYDLWLARAIRDCRIGFGEREVGRVLLEQVKDKPINVFNIGRADDIFYIGLRLVETKQDLKGGEYWKYLYDVITNKDKYSYEEVNNITKWLPRERGNNRQNVKKFRKVFSLTSKQYRKLISNNTTVESILSRGETVKKYETVPSLAMLKHFNTFNTKDHDNFESYLESVKKGEKKLNTSTTTPYDLYKKYRDRKIKAEDCDIIFNQMKKVDLGKILPIIDVSGSMFDNFDSIGKAISIGHYVSKNSSYMNNQFVTFSNRPKLVKLANDYKKDMNIIESADWGYNTDFGKVMELIGKADEDLPNFILVLSDMEFDEGSEDKKGVVMKKLHRHNPNLKIIWWNIAMDKSTFPETDSYGNIFLSGYNPRLLELLEVGFDGQKFIDNIVYTYKEKMKDIII